MLNLKIIVMAESNGISTGDVVCLKSDKDRTTFQKFTVGSQHSGSEYEVYWFNGGELKHQIITILALHKLN